ncbi:MAG: DNA starvation/stationary phase protection protein [Campylobacterales bacterium]|nr:DNA starvation/stationary phase protection protein [Campylobacterales bacterium]
MKSVEILKQIQVDSMAFYIKVHNYHWNVKGMEFFPVHEMTEKIYNSFSGIYDDSAERVIQLGEKPVLKMSEIVSKTTIKEEEGDSFSGKEVMENILADYKHFLQSFKDLSSAADEAGDTTTVAYADEQVASLEKSIWMISQSLA